MKVSVLSENLNKALSIAFRVVTTRAQLPILANVLIKASSKGLEILATDLEMGVRVRVGAKVEEEGELCVSARVLTEFMSTLSSGVVEIGVEKENLTIKSAKTSARIPGIEGGEFPAIPSSLAKANFEIETGRLGEIYSRVAFAAAKEDSRPILTGMLLKQVGGKLVLVSTDGFRLSVDEEKVVVDGEISQFILPVRVLQEVVKGVEKTEKKLAVFLDVDRQQVIFKAANVEWISRLLSGEFPPYSQIMPSSFVTRLVVQKDGLVEAVKRAVIFARESSNIVKLTIDGGKLVVSANSSSVGGGETEVDVEMEGEPLAVAFNGKYILDYLNVVSSEEVVFESAGALKAGVFKMPGKKLVHIIMPVRVQG